jgi:hypothetical protein
LSRLDSAIRRLEAQRACLDRAAALIEGVPGPVLELGLGNGRTYDHLRERLPGREIFAFDRQVVAHPDCIPDGTHLILGDFRETLPAAHPRLASAALIHADFGSGDRAATRDLAAFVAGAIDVLIAADGIVVSDQPLHQEPGWTGRFTGLDLPDGISESRYFLYRRHGPDDATPATARVVHDKPRNRQ